VRKSKVTDEHVACAVWQVDGGIPVGDVWRKLVISEKTFR
jgi:hypothetical protein